VKKAKQAALQKYVADRVPQEVLDVYKDMMEQTKANPLTMIGSSQFVAGPLQECLTKRKGTISVIAEYKRKALEVPNVVIKTILEPEFYAKIFRESNVATMAVLANEQMGGCTYNDLARVVEEQWQAQVVVPGPIPIINSNIIINMVQIAQSKVHNVAAVTIPLSMIDAADQLEELLTAAAAVQIKAIVIVASVDKAQLAVAQGAKIIRVDNVEARDAIVMSVLKIVYIPANNNKLLLEIEDAWNVRRKGLFQAVWVSEALFKENNAGAVVKSMRSKSSSTWASPKAATGQGEGAREYLGDILM
jgi:indole-3-glycerol phosphate synthase